MSEGEVEADDPRRGRLKGTGERTRRRSLYKRKYQKKDVFLAFALTAVFMVTFISWSWHHPQT